MMSNNGGGKEGSDQAKSNRDEDEMGLIEQSQANDLRMELGFQEKMKETEKTREKKETEGAGEKK